MQLKYPKRLFCLLAQEMVPGTDKPKGGMTLNWGEFPGDLEIRSFPSPLGKLAAVYELKDVARFEDIDCSYDENGEPANPTSVKRNESIANTEEIALRLKQAVKLQCEATQARYDLTTRAEWLIGAEGVLDEAVIACVTALANRFEANRGKRQPEKIDFKQAASNLLTA